MLAFPSAFLMLALVTSAMGGDTPPVSKSVPAATSAQETSATLPEGAGLAARYPGDVGIERDPSVLSAENFEKGTLSDLGKRWQEVTGPR